jgi:hypothetical protein
MKRNLRTNKGQSLVEYALGLGCIACLCMAGLASLGDISADMIRGVETNINYQGGFSKDTTPIVKRTATPWVFQ